VCSRVWNVMGGPMSRCINFLMQPQQTKGLCLCFLSTHHCFKACLTRAPGMVCTPQVFAVETEGAASYAAAHAAGEPVAISAIDSIATSLGALAVTHATLRTTINTSPMQVSDRDAVRACLRFADEHRALVEPACGASLAAVYMEDKLKVIQDSLGENKNIVVVVCGGSIVSLELLEGWKRQFEI
jgi:L-serine/L-threonine ammonia-lyase